MTAALRLGQSVWLAPHADPSRPSYPSIRGNRNVDVAIVGGGITGALCACAFAAEGVSVVVLEGGRAGRGSTAASSALLLPEPDHGMGELARRYGSPASRLIWRVSHDAARELVETIRRFRIACGLEERDAVYCATNADGVRRLRAEFLLRARAGFKGDWLTSGELRRLTGLSGGGGIRTSGNAQFDPYRACLGLLAAAARCGAEIFERSRVTRIDSLRDRVRIHTRNARVDAARVVIATGYATAHFRPLAGRFRMYRTYVMATEPLSAAKRREVGLADLMVWDTDRPYHYARWTEDDRLLLGGGDRPVRAGQRRDVQFASATRQLRQDFETMFPALTTVEIPKAWEGLFAMTPDSLPYVGPHQRYPRHLFALGYGGNGMTFGCLAARLLVDWWRGSRSPDQHLFRFGRVR